jgi:hypothetical protein
LDDILDICYILVGDISHNSMIYFKFFVNVFPKCWVEGSPIDIGFDFWADFDGVKL